MIIVLFFYIYNYIYFKRYIYIYVSFKTFILVYIHIYISVTCPCISFKSKCTFTKIKKQDFTSFKYIEILNSIYLLNFKITLYFEIINFLNQIPN